MLDVHTHSNTLGHTLKGTHQMVGRNGLDYKARVRGQAFGVALHRLYTSLGSITLPKTYDSDDPLTDVWLPDEILLDVGILKLTGVARVTDNLACRARLFGREAMLAFVLRHAAEGPMCAQHALDAFNEDWKYSGRGKLLHLRKKIEALDKLPAVVARTYPALRDPAHRRRIVLRPHGGHCYLDGSLPYTNPHQQE